jgi:hypothetical protein
VPGRLVGGSVVDEEVPVAHRISRQAVELPYVPALRDGGELANGPITRLCSWVRRGALDRALAAGADPSASSLLACRASALTGRRSRQRLAARIAEIRRAAQSRRRGVSVAVEPDRREVVAATGRLIELEELLRSSAPVYAQGIALMMGVLCEGGGCVYAPRWPGELSETLDRVLAALEGRVPQ